MDESNGTDAATFVVTLMDGVNVQVFIEKTGEGTVIGAGSYDLNATAQISATPAIGYLFNSWSGDFNSTEMEEQLIVDKNYSFVANFTKDLGDNDGDELTNYFELVEFGSDPNSADSDEDGFSDFEENKTGLNPNLANHNFRALWNEKINEASSQGITDGVNWITYNRSQHDLNTTADIQYEFGYADGYSETLADLKLANELDYNASILQAAKDREDLVKSELKNGVDGLIYLDQLRQNAQPYAQNWYYQPELGWLWTRPDIYPLVYFADTNNSLGSRWLYSVKLEAIEDGSYFDFEADKIIKTKE